MFWRFDLRFDLRFDFALLRLFFNGLHPFSLLLTPLQQCHSFISTEKDSWGGVLDVRHTRTRAGTGTHRHPRAHTHIVLLLSNSHSIKPFISKQTYIHQYTKWSISIQQSTTAALRPKDKHKGRTQPICLECRSQLVQFDPVISLSTDPTHASQMSSLSLSLHMKMCTNVFICEMLQCPSCGI